MKCIDLHTFAEPQNIMTRVTTNLLHRSVVFRVINTFLDETCKYGTKSGNARPEIWKADGECGKFIALNH